MRKILPLAAGLLAFAPAAAAAQIYTGEALYQKCAANIPLREKAAAQNYIAGIADAVQALQGKNGRPLMACISPLAAPGDIKEIICQGLAANLQERENNNAAPLVIKYLKNAFPCQ